jgi:hypothetical protein
MMQNKPTAAVLAASILVCLVLGTGGAGFQNDPPEIIFREAPAILVVIDGDPQLAQMSEYDLQYVANTAFFIATQKNVYYLYGDGMWLIANTIEGPWKNTTDLPPDIQEISKRIAEDEKKQAEEEAKAAAEAGETLDDPEAEGVEPDNRIPEIIVRTGPAEVIFTDGPPEFIPVEDTQLLGEVGAQLGQFLLRDVGDLCRRYFQVHQRDHARVHVGGHAGGKPHRSEHGRGLAGPRDRNRRSRLHCVAVEGLDLRLVDDDVPLLRLQQHGPAAVLVARFLGEGAGNDGCGEREDKYGDEQVKS